MSDKCRSCGATVIWAATGAGKRMPLDAQPHADGNVILIEGVAMVLPAEVLANARAKGEKLYRSHFATCTNAAGHRRRKERG